MASILIAFFSLVLLMIFHELGHFLAAKKTGVKVEEFGLGYPPRIFSKKIGETLFSINLLPLGAFVKILGEEGGDNSERSFSRQSILKRAFIVSAGCISFWIVSFFLLSLAFYFGTFVSTLPDEPAQFIQVIKVLEGSPAFFANLRTGDLIKKIIFEGETFEIHSIRELQELTKKFAGNEIILEIEREGTSLKLPIVPRANPPEKEGPLGIALVGVKKEKYPLFLAFLKGANETIVLTGGILKEYAKIFEKIIRGEKIEAKLVGPVGVMNIFAQAAEKGISYFLQFIALISIYLAIFNLLPIPALDGGKLLFLGIEAIRKKPVDPKIEQKITLFFFGLLVSLAILVTIRDILELI
jgi:regulator of sigma E protease